MREYIGISAPGAVPILAVHNESVVECDEKDVEKAEAWLEKAMIDRIDEGVNGLKADDPLVPIEVELQSGRSWGGE
jgi:DNA polymerase I-like protein with 3'-5' exonuclease and polymerase domains